MCVHRDSFRPKNSANRAGYMLLLRLVSRYNLPVTWRVFKRIWALRPSLPSSLASKRLHGFFLVGNPYIQDWLLLERQLIASGVPQAPCSLLYSLLKVNNVRIVVNCLWCGSDIEVASWVSDPTDKGELLIKHQIKPSASGVRITAPVYPCASQVEPCHGLVWSSLQALFLSNWALSAIEN